MSEADKQRQESINRLGNVSVEDSIHSDNLAIALASYFSRHMDRPENDPDGEDGWGEWVIEKTNIALRLIHEHLATRPTAK